jgi:hypothetical protein
VTTLAVLAACVPLTACGLGAGKTPSNVTLTISDDFGTHVIKQTATPNSDGSETVMQLLMRNGAITTKYGGGFVQSINGLAGNATKSPPVDWFYYVNGVQASMGASATNVNPGDRIWWDRHDWSATESIPAVVGSYPAPFVGGIAGKRYPVTEICETPSSVACTTVQSRLRAAGVPVALGSLGTDEPDTLRVLVGPWGTIKGDPAAAYLEAGPRTSGVYARFTSDGRQLLLLNAQGQVARTVTTAGGLVAADAIPNEVPTWLVTGTDAAGTDAAARAFDAPTLHNRFAVAATAGQTVPVPLGGA